MGEQQIYTTKKSHSISKTINVVLSTVNRYDNSLAFGSAAFFFLIGGGFSFFGLLQTSPAASSDPLQNWLFSPVLSEFSNSDSLAYRRRARNLSFPYTGFFLTLDLLPFTRPCPYRFHRSDSEFTSIFHSISLRQLSPKRVLRPRDDARQCGPVATRVFLSKIMFDLFNRQLFIIPYRWTSCKYL